MFGRFSEVDISMRPLMWWPCDQCDGEGLEPAHQARANRAPDFVMRWKGPKNKKELRKLLE